MGDAAAVASPVAREPARHRLDIAFSGSGSEYFRIWSVNLLLTVVTLGLYHPWAKVRRLRYFYGNTTIGGDPLDFHGNPKRMLRGMLLVGVLFGLYAVAGRVSPVAGVVAFFIAAAVWPALFRAGQQFRLGNTSWRGLRFRFDGDLGSAYAAVLPLFLPGALVLVTALVAQLQAGNATADPARRSLGPQWVLPALGVAILVLPWAFWRLKAYQHSRFALAQLRPKLSVGPRAFYGLALKTFGVMLASLLTAAVLAGLLAGLAAVARRADAQLPRGAVPVLAAASFLLVYAAVLLLLVPYCTSRFQNLLWNDTGSADAWFESHLRFRPMLWLTLKNWLLVLVTVGLYAPFAKVAMTHLRLQAVTVCTRIAPDDLLAEARPAANDATGDMAGDFFGFDVGL